MSPPDQGAIPPPPHDGEPDEDLHLDGQKLTGSAAQLRAPRDKPARYNPKIIGGVLAAGVSLIVLAIFLQPSLKKRHGNEGAPPPPKSEPASPPVAPLAYDSQPANPATGAAGIDCTENPGFANCAHASGGAGSAAAGGGDSQTANAGGAAAGQAGANGKAAAGGISGAISAVRGPDDGARTSGLFFGGPAGQPLKAAENAVAGAPAAAGAAIGGLLPPWPGPPQPKPPPPEQDVLAANGQGEKAAFLNKAADTSAQDYVNAKVQKARSQYEVKAGEVIPAALLTAVNSDLPGEVIGQVTQPVYDHITGHYVLIPQGTRIIGKYDSQVAYGQSRALIVWHRLIFPNGDSLNFGSMNATDPTGAAGVADKVDDHFLQLAKGIVLSTLLSVGASSAEDAEARSSGTLIANSAESGLATEAQQVGDRITERDLNRQPTIIIRQGAQIRVLVDKDMIIDPYR